MIQTMADKKVVDGLEIKKQSSTIECEDCATNKGHAVSHKDRSQSRADLPGSSLHLDTVGPIREASLAGSKYFVLCKDEASSYRKVDFIESKSEIPDVVKKMITQAEFETKNKTAQISTDNGTEFVNKRLASFLEENGITHLTSAPYVPQQNGLIERDIRTVVESARTMMNSSSLPKKLWAESVNTAVHILNRVPTTKRPDITPFEAWFRCKPNVKNFRIFGQKAIVNRPVIFRDGKWDTTGDTMLLIGYTRLLNTYRFYCPKKDKVVISCDITFLNDDRDLSSKNKPLLAIESIRRQTPQVDSGTDEEHLQQPDMDGEILDSSQSLTISEIESYEESNAHEAQDPPTRESSMDISTPIDLPRAESQQIERPNGRRAVAFEIPRDEIPRELYIRNRPPPLVESRLRPRSETFTRHSDSHHARISKAVVTDEPMTYAEAVKRPDAKHWVEAMDDEMSSLKKNKVWTLVERPKNTNIVTNRWVYKVKRKPNGEVDRHRARLVARGFTQVHGVDYSETYVPVANMLTVRMLLAYAAIINLKFRQFDIKTAFLYGNLEEDVYMEQPDGYKDETNRVCALKKSLYGLKQAPRQWNKEFSNFLKSLKLKESKFDRCVYFRSKPDYLLLVIYVDDGLIFAENTREIDKILRDLKNRFEVHEADSSVFLGFQIKHNKDNSLSLHQEGYVNKMLTRFNMAEAKSVDNPSTLSKDTIEERKSESLGANVPYREAVGSLMYAANTVRVDIAHAVNRVSRQVSQPTTFDWSNVKRIFRYLMDKQKLGITYSKRENTGLYAYCDADFAGDSTGKSTTGFVMMFGGGPIHWKS